MEYLPALAVLAAFGWLIWWGHSQDQKEHPGYSIRRDMRRLLTSLGDMTLKETVVVVWSLCLYLAALAAFFWIAALAGLTGPVCWHC